MKRSLSPVLFILILMAGAAFAQNPPPANIADRPQADGPSNKPNLLRELGLSPDQVRQIRMLNQGRKPQMEAAARRLREANRALDEAIYSESVNDADFQVRLKEFQAAQADIARLRFESELGVRKVLTPEQLLRFRELRRRFAERRMAPGGRENRPDDRPMRRMGRPPLQDRPY